MNPYIKIIDQLALVFNDLEHLDHPEISKDIEGIIFKVKIIKDSRCGCGAQIHESYDGYCSDCG